MNHTKIAIIGPKGQGKSWLANRLIQAIENDREYKYDDDIDERDNIFGENDFLQREQVSPNNAKFQYKTYKIKRYPIEIVETIGIGSISDTPIHNQIQLILNQIKIVDYFIFVQQCDYQLEAEILSQLKIISKFCTPQKLIVYISKDYIYRKNGILNQAKWKQIMNDWNQQRDLFNNSVGLQSDAYQLGKYILNLKQNQQIQQDHKIIKIIVHCKILDTGQLKLPDQYKISLIDSVEDQDEAFDLAIIDFQLLRKEQKWWQQIDDDLFQQKCAVYVEKQSINEFNQLYQQFKKINYMKQIISLETINILHRNHRTINKQQVSKWLKGNI